MLSSQSPNLGLQQTSTQQQWGFLSKIWRVMVYHISCHLDWSRFTQGSFCHQWHETRLKIWLILLKLGKLYSKRDFEPLFSVLVHSYTTLAYAAQTILNPWSIRLVLALVIIFNFKNIYLIKTIFLLYLFSYFEYKVN